VIGKLHGVERPHFGAQTTHRKNGSTVTGMPIDNMGLNGQDSLHYQGSEVRDQESDIRVLYGEHTSQHFLQCAVIRDLNGWIPDL
jgi:hypothetical protein